MTAFQDAAEKLLWPEKRTGKATIKVTGTDSVLKIGTSRFAFRPAPRSILLANINVYAALQPGQACWRQLKQLNREPAVAGAAGAGPEKPRASMTTS